MKDRIAESEDVLVIAERRTEKAILLLLHEY